MRVSRVQRRCDLLRCSPVAAACSVPPAMLHICSKAHHSTHPVAATFCIPTKCSFQLMAMSLHPISPSSLFWRLCSCLFPLLPDPLPGLALLLGLPSMEFGTPKSESCPGLGCRARSASCSHTGTSLADGSGALSASCVASALKLSWPPVFLVLDLPLCLVSGLALGCFGATLLQP